MWCAPSATARRTSSGLSMGGFAALHFGLRHPAARALAGRCGRRLRRQAGTAAEPRPVHARGGRSCRSDRHGGICPSTLPESGYAQCLRAKDEMGWLRFAEQLGRALRERDGDDIARRARHASLAMASCGRIASDLDLPILLVAGDEDTPCLEPIFSQGDAARRCAMRHAAFRPFAQSGRTGAVQRHCFRVPRGRRARPMARMAGRRSNLGA